MICNLTNLRLAYKRVCERMHHANTKTGIQPQAKPVNNDLDLRRAAMDLGVNHSHLWRVMNGKRESRVLTQRYQEWHKAHIGQ
jgi:hypothetical protein